MTNRTIGRYNVKTLGLKCSENKLGKRKTKQEALKAAIDSVSAQGEEAEIRSLSNGIFVNFLKYTKGKRDEIRQNNQRQR